MKKIFLHTPDTLSDEKLAELFIKSGERESFEKLYARYFKPLSKYLGWLANDLDLAKDIAQTIMLRFYENPAAFDPSRNFKVWLFSAAKNQWKNELRHEEVKSRYKSLVVVENDEADTQNEEHTMRRQMIEKALNALSESHREVFVLKYSNNLSVKEISAICACREGTVKSRLFYAMKQIKETIKSGKVVL